MLEDDNLPGDAKPGELREVASSSLDEIAKDAEVGFASETEAFS